METYRAAARSQIMYLAQGQGVLWLLGLVGMFLGMKRLGQRIREKERAQADRDSYLDELQKSLENVKILRGLFSI